LFEKYGWLQSGSGHKSAQNRTGKTRGKSPRQALAILKHQNPSQQPAMKNLHKHNFSYHLIKICATKGRAVPDH